MKMNDDWKIWRPVIWLTMVAIAVALLIQPWFLAAVPLGMAIGAGIRIQQRRRRAAAATAAAPQKRPRDQRKRPK
jgi:hypothetical protein